jgi:drug/metabolite transporter (DMT)-like permease
LGTVCTSVAYVYGVDVMKDLSAFRVVLITNLEPVYAIVLALLIFGKTEQMSGEFYIGALIILTAIFSYPILKNKLDKK